MVGDVDEKRDSTDTKESDNQNSVFDEVERAFTCVACGFATTAEVPPLQAAVQSVCPNCGDWTTQTAGQGELVEVAQAVATELAGPTLTERQALAYLLRDILGFDRQPTAGILDTSASNVDNLQRTARDKLKDAERVLDALETIQPVTA